MAGKIRYNFKRYLNIANPQMREKEQVIIAPHDAYVSMVDELVKPHYSSSSTCLHLFIILQLSRELSSARYVPKLARKHRYYTGTADLLPLFLSFCMLGTAAHLETSFYHLNMVVLFFFFPFFFLFFFLFFFFRVFETMTLNWQKAWATFELTFFPFMHCMDYLGIFIGIFGRMEKENIQIFFTRFCPSIDAILNFVCYRF